MVRKENSDCSGALRLVKLKDFAVGQTVYTLHERVGRNAKDEIREQKVVRVGRKYVKVDDSWETEYLNSVDKHEFLIQNTDFGDKMKLFPNREAVDAYCEKKALYKELSKRFHFGQDNFTLKQLQAVKEALDGEGES